MKIGCALPIMGQSRVFPRHKKDAKSGWVGWLRSTTLAAFSHPLMTNCVTCWSRDAMATSPCASSTFSSCFWTGTLQSMSATRSSWKRVWSAANCYRISQRFPCHQAFISGDWEIWTSFFSRETTKKTLGRKKYSLKALWFWKLPLSLAKSLELQPWRRSCLFARRQTPP